MKRQTLWWIAAVVLIGAVGLMVWAAMPEEEPKEVKTALTNRVAIQQLVYATGTVRPVTRQEIRALSLGKVTKVYVKAGDTVGVGQTLIQLDTATADAQVAQAQAGVDVAQANLDAAKLSLEAAKLNPAGGKQAEIAVVQGDAALKQAKANLKMAQTQRTQLTLKADIAGTVTEVNVETGGLASSQMPLAVVSDLNRLEVRAQLNEVDAGKVKLGQQVKVTSQAVKGETVDGKVTSIAPEAKPGSGLQGSSAPVVDIAINLDKVPAGLKPGFTVNLEIMVAQKEGALVIPQEALFQEINKSFVYRVIDGKLAKTEINLGLSTEVYQEALTGLNEGDVVVINPSPDFFDGMPVKPVPGSGAG